LLDGIALHAADISPWHPQFSTLVKANLAYARLTFGNRATMTTGEAADSVALDRLVELAFANVLVQDISEGRQLVPLFTYSKTAGYSDDCPM
ncbi:MAG: hypothetical protein DMG93_22125, partial [Acidobacteria bacterium]